MPVETIKCRECGSAEVTEFKPGSYICAHCEAVFKHVQPAGASGGAAGCEIDACGVAAIGRCSTCGRAFCGTHQARHRAGRKYVDLCAACQPRGPLPVGDAVVAALEAQDVKTRQAVAAFFRRATHIAPTHLVTGNHQVVTREGSWRRKVRYGTEFEYQLGHRVYCWAERSALNKNESQCVVITSTGRVVLAEAIFRPHEPEQLVPPWNRRVEYGTALDGKWTWQRVGNGTEGTLPFICWSRHGSYSERDHILDPGPHFCGDPPWERHSDQQLVHRIELTTTWFASQLDRYAAASS